MFRVIFSLFCALIFVACAAVPEQEALEADPAEDTDPLGAEGDDPIASQRATCNAYLECLTEVSPAATGAAVEAYGTEGPCWQSEDNAALCAKACADATWEIGLEYPNVSECAPMPLQPLEEGLAGKPKFNLQVDEAWTSNGFPCMGYDYTQFVPREVSNAGLEVRLKGVGMSSGEAGRLDFSCDWEFAGRLHFRCLLEEEPVALALMGTMSPDLERVNLYLIENVEWGGTSCSAEYAMFGQR